MIFFYQKRILTEGYNTMKILKNVLRILFFLLFTMTIICIVFDFYCADIILLIFAFVCLVLQAISFLRVWKK
jgi:hypothetical protein